MKKTIFGETEIKRFGCDVYYDQGMYEDPNGAFVSYEDHAKVVAALNDILCAIAEKGVKLCQEIATVYERYNITEMPDGALVDMQTIQESRNMVAPLSSEDERG